MYTCIWCIKYVLIAHIWTTGWDIFQIFGLIFTMWCRLTELTTIGYKSSKCYKE